MSDIGTLPPARPRRGNVLLILSLCLNVALIAMIVVGIVQALRAPFRPGPGGPLSPQSLLTEVQPAEKPKIQAIIDAHAARLRELRIEAVQARGAAYRIFAEPSFSPSEFAAALDRVQTANVALQNELMKETAESVTQLTPAERRAIADKIRSRARPLWRVFMGRPGG